MCWLGVTVGMLNIKTYKPFDSSSCCSTVDAADCSTWSCSHTFNYFTRKNNPPNRSVSGTRIHSGKLPVSSNDYWTVIPSRCWGSDLLSLGTFDYFKTKTLQCSLTHLHLVPSMSLIQANETSTAISSLLKVLRSLWR